MDGGELIAEDEADALSDAAVARLRQHPRFREAVQVLAAASLAGYEAQDPATRWLTRDLGRSALYLAALIWDATPMGLSVAALAAGAAATGAASRGRVLAFVQYAHQAGHIIVPAGPEPWGRRRLTLTPAFMAPLHHLIRGGLQAVALIDPRVAADLPELSQQASLARIIRSGAKLILDRPLLLQNPGGPFREIFVGRDGGMRVLQRLMITQPEDRARLLDVAEVSRSELSRRYGVSRTHINRMLADAQGAGALTPLSPDRVAFSPAFSDEVEAYFAGMLLCLVVVMQQTAEAAAA
ncbi:hypothetical protein [Phenylobacterium sp.]|jgi:hypothetical protein|uniref:hypothetical protein n=1 Tax=Phenylobacterium sp. TaxID=1871053 RepID=UPI002E34576B|nr:hypothetical protein [Phenylobacterium sp.]HEX3363542.1 hypothetical protein [Phenylobacterium sp.]